MPWKDELPESVREWEEVKNSETREQFFEQMSNQRSLLGQSIRIPGEDASAEDKAAFVEKIITRAPTDIMRKPTTDEDVIKFYREQGMPEKGDQYVDPKFEVPEGVSVDEKRIAAFKDLAHKHNLTQKQFEGLTHDFMSPELMGAAEGYKSEQAANAELKESWGEGYARKVTQAKMIRDEFFPELTGDLDARTTKAFAALAVKIGVESTDLSNNEGGGGKDGLTKDEAILKIAEITNNKEHPYWNSSDMGHDAARRKMRELNIIAYN